MLPTCFFMRLFFVFLQLYCLGLTHNKCFGEFPTVENLTIEEKVGQILMVFIVGEEANVESKQLIENAFIGNIIYYRWSNGLHNPQQIQTLSNNLQRLAKLRRSGIPLLIAVDQEGGRVNRLTDGFTLFPSQEVLARSENPDLVEACAFGIATELKAVGINMNLAPIVDVNSNPNRLIIGSRSFGSSPEVVAKLGGLALNCYRNTNVIATLKHFPGYGEASVDPHLGLPTVNKSRSELDKTELFPFKQLCPQADAIMTAHILMPALDPNNCATLSKAIVTNILRTEWGYQGIIITDSLVMEGILNACQSVEEAALRAFEAGHDILLFGGKQLGQKDARDLTSQDFIRIHKYLVDSVKNGRITEERLNSSVQRILQLKINRGLFEERYPDQNDILQNVNTIEHQNLVKTFK